MIEPEIQCPKCFTTFKPNEAFAAQYVEETKKKYEQQLQAKEAEAAKREASVRIKEEELARFREEAEDSIRKQVKASQKKIEEEARKTAKALLDDELEQKAKELAQAKELQQSAEAKLAKSRKEQEEREAAFKQKEEALEKQSQELAEKAKAEAAKERRKIAEEETKKARLLFSEDMEKKEQEAKELAERFELQSKKLAEAQKAQADLVRKERELADKAREMDLTIEKRVTESLTEARVIARKEAEDSLLLKVKERDLVIEQMKQQIDEMKTRAEQGSQQLQGEVLELELEAALRARFPLDTIEEVGKGVIGADILQKVAGASGQPIGSILWETKRTKNWMKDWLPKLREDQRAVKADFSILVSQALPKEVEGFDCVDGVWVTSYRTALPVALALRQALQEVAMARQAGEGQQTKMQLVYTYLTGASFRQRVEAIVEKFTEMHSDLVKEQTWTKKQWAKREKQIQGVLESTAGMYGDLQGIAGKSLQEIEGLKMSELEFQES